MISKVFGHIAQKRQANRDDALAAAIFANDDKAVVGHLGKGASPNGIVNGRHYMLAYAVTHTNNLKIYEALLAAGADVSKPTANHYGGQSRLSDAAADHGRPKEVVAVLKAAEARYIREVGPLPPIQERRSCPIKKAG